MEGGGKYEDVCALAREATQAQGVVLIVMDGARGNGLSVQLPLEKLILLPDLLRYMAKEIDKDLIEKGLKNAKPH